MKLIPVNRLSDIPLLFLKLQNKMVDSITVFSQEVSIRSSPLSYGLLQPVSHSLIPSTVKNPIKDNFISAQKHYDPGKFVH